jgi:hypothetical protein
VLDSLKPFAGLMTLVVIGILVAADFDKKARAAARMVPNLVLRRYSVRFHFCDGGA